MLSESTQRHFNIGCACSCLEPLTHSIARVLLLIVAMGAVIAFWPLAFAFDPVDTFIVKADSIASVAGDDALDAYICANDILVGAAVGQLLDAALELREDGQVEAAEENLVLADRLARSYRAQTGSSAQLDLVARYRGWDARQHAVWRHAKALVDTATEARDSGRYDRATGLLNEAMALYESIDDTRSIAVLWGSLGVVYWYKGDLKAVAGHYEKALAARRAIEDRILEARTLNGLGSVNYRLGNLDLARAYYEQAIDLRLATGDTEGLATSITYLGNTYIAMGRLLEARTTLERALPVIESSGNLTQQYELLTSIASLNAEMGRISRSNSTYREALALALRMDDPTRQTICHNNLALNLAEAYRYGEALRELSAVKALLEEHPNPEQALIYHRNSGITNLRTGELEWAESDFDTLLRLAGEYQMPVFELEALGNLGYLAREQGELEEGLGYAERARALAQEMDNSTMIRQALILTAEIERDLGRYERAIEKWERLLALDRAEGVDTDIAVDLLGMATNHVLAGRSQEARKILRGIRQTVEETEDGDLILALAFGMGHSFESTDPESARLYYEKALDLLDETRCQIGGTEVRTGYLGGVRRFYFEEVAIYYAGLAKGDDAQVWSGRAFETIERAKARGLVDLIEAPVLARGSSAEDALLDSLYSLDPDSPGDADRRRRLKALYARTRQERLAAIGTEEAAAPSVACPDDIGRIIPKDAALLAYAVGDTTSLLWVIDSAGCQVYSLPKRATLRAAVARLRDAISHPVVADEVLRSSAYDLYLDLLAPARDRLERVKQLIVVPDGILLELPFEVLLTEAPSGKTAWNEMPYLARTHTVTYVPSATVYVALRAKEGDIRFDKDLVAFGDPDYTMLEPLPCLKRRVVGLPHSEDEVLSISSLFATNAKDIYLGQDANEAVLKAKLRTESIRVVHLATHGIVDAAEPSASGIVLCPDVRGTEDGYLQTLEVMSLPMRVGLVVLSACESARGQIGRGEGVVGLSRAFLASGAQGIIASLWPVSDESTARLMAEFYKRMLKDKHPASRAINEARLVLMADSRYAHPFHWSPFVMIGLEDSPW